MVVHHYWDEMDGWIFLRWYPLIQSLVNRRRGEDSLTHLGGRYGNSVRALKMKNVAVLKFARAKPFCAPRRRYEMLLIVILSWLLHYWRRDRWRCHLRKQKQPGYSVQATISWLERLECSAVAPDGKLISESACLGRLGFFEIASSCTK